MPVRIVQSKQNARLKQLRRALAAPGRDSDGLAGIEGPNLLGEAVRAGLRVDCVFVAQGAEALLEGVELAEETEVLVMPRELLAGAMTTETPQAVAALVAQPVWSWEQVIGIRGRPAPLLVVLAGVQDPGNLGTILRSAEAFGASGVVSLAGTVSAWNPKAVRGSAGSVFRLPMIAAGAEDAIPRLHKERIRIWATLPHGATPANEANLAGPVALVIGNEGNGVPAAVLARADDLLTIPCPGPVESLNAAVAASVLLYEASRQRVGLRMAGSDLSQNAGRMGHPGPRSGGSR